MSPMLGRLEKTFKVYVQGGTLNDEMQAGSSYTLSGKTVRVLAGAVAPKQTIVYGQTEHTVTHMLTTRGKAYPNAKPGDVLVSPTGDSYFVLGIEDPGLEQRWTVFATELRYDMDVA